MNKMEKINYKDKNIKQSFVKIGERDKSLVRTIRKKREKAQINSTNKVVS